ncbi:putative quinol monooxygenase [Niabella ginsengisoli]|uniref:Antibiotic biosynthesis monooxygenase n=1 Tax=Niabella ginsengisoli TaxID=522298 RepID=A0ABS9SQI4_9BACT|nr:putative quinol monooxygenase [Niabella ginsengisoli]MCH5600379.1 antibiotic biosynthesis monooxygenase [Niabella ginsengisoli]
MIRIALMAFLTPLIVCSCNNSHDAKADELNSMMIRIAEIEVDSNYLDEYKKILKEEAEASIRLEPGVISIYPMQQKENPAQIRILEIYANKNAYESHLKTPHFQKYKTTTLDMVKALRLIDIEAMDTKTMPSIFRKLEE